MSWVWLAIKVALMWLKRWLTLDAEKRAARKEALSDVKEGIKNRDRGAITRGFDRARRMR